MYPANSQGIAGRQEKPLVSRLAKSSIYVVETDPESQQKATFPLYVPGVDRQAKFLAQLKMRADVEGIDGKEFRFKSRSRSVERPKGKKRSPTPVTHKRQRVQSPDPGIHGATLMKKSMVQIPDPGMAGAKKSRVQIPDPGMYGATLMKKSMVQIPDPGMTGAKKSRVQIPGPGMYGAKKSMVQSPDLGMAGAKKSMVQISDPGMHGATLQKKSMVQSPDPGMEGAKKSRVQSPDPGIHGATLMKKSSSLPPKLNVALKDFSIHLEKIPVQHNSVNSSVIFG